MSEQRLTDKLADRILREIRNETIVNSSNKLLSENELIKKFSVTRYALRKAIDILCQAGYLFQSQGSGVYIRKSNWDNFINLQEGAGLNAEYGGRKRVIKTINASKSLVFARDANFKPISNDIDPDSTLTEIKRFRTLNGVPFLYEHSYYVTELTGIIPNSAIYGSLVNYIQTSTTINYGFSDKLVSASATPAKIAQFFNHSSDEPSLHLQDDFYTNTGQIYNFSQSYFNYENTTLYMFSKW